MFIQVQENENKNINNNQNQEVVRKSCSILWPTPFLSHSIKKLGPYSFTHPPQLHLNSIKNIPNQLFCQKREAETKPEKNKIKMQATRATKDETGER